MEETGEYPLITFKSTLNRWHNLIFAVSLSLLAFLMLALFNFKLLPISAMILIAAGFLLYFGTRYLAQCQTTIEVNDELLAIEQCNEFFKRTETFKIPLNQLRGYEVRETSKGDYSLFLYDQSFHYYKYPLFRINDQLAVDSYLQRHLTKLDKDKNPRFASFSSAFLFVIRNYIIFIGLCLLSITTLYFQNIKHQFWNGDMPTVLFSILIGLSLWWLLIRKQTKRNYFRYGAYFWFSGIFLYLPPLAFIPALSNYIKHEEEPIHLEYTFNIAEHSSGNLFRIDNVSYNPDTIMYADIQARAPGRSMKFAVDHAFVTPIGSGDRIRSNGIYSYWLVKTYTQSIKKLTNSITRREMIENFHRQSVLAFKKSFQRKPVFYHITRKSEKIRWLIQTSKNANLGIVMVPHWETLESYRKGIRNQIAMFIAFVLVLNLFGCIAVAINR